MLYLLYTKPTDRRQKLYIIFTEIFSYIIRSMFSYLFFFVESRIVLLISYISLDK